METKRAVAGTVVGGIVLYVVGYLIFTKAFASFYAANAGSATGVDRGGELLWAMLVGNFAYAALVTYTLARRSGSWAIAEGARVGAIVGFLIWCTADFVFYGYSNIANLTRTIVDPLLEIVHGGIGGAVIAAVVGRMAGGNVQASRI
jgi:hypothetical protein